mgnify:CR=1 FL=1
MNKIKALIFSLIFCLLGTMVYGQKKHKATRPAFEIKFVMNGFEEDTMLYVANYYADKTYMQDSLFLSKKEPHTFVFSGDTLPPRGVYILANQNKVKYLEFIIDTSYFFTLRTQDIDSKSPDFINNIVFEGSPDNIEMNVFFKKVSYFQGKIFKINKDISLLESEKKPDKKLIQQMKKELESWQDSNYNYCADFVAQHGTTSLFGRTQRLAQDVDIPEEIQKGEDVVTYNYYLNHYWDNCDFSEGALIYTPVFQPKLVKYFDKVVPPIVDSIIKYADILVEKAKASPELFKYVVWYITNKYERSQYVGHDAVFVHMVLNYYAKGLCPWTDEAVLERMVERAEQLDKVLLGKVAPELYMFDTNERFISSHSFDKKYTILWFWDVTCGHCKSVTPTLVEFYNRAKDSLDFEVYAVCITSDTASWKKAIVSRQLPFVNVGGNRANMDYRQVFGVTTTPYIYVLDREKKIICKKIGVEQLESFLKDHEAGKRIY